MKTMLGPIMWDVYVHIQSKDGQQHGRVTLGFTPGKVPTEEDVVELVGKALAALPEGYELMSPDLFTSVVFEEKTGQFTRYAAPAAFRYDVAALTARALATQKGEEKS